MEDLYEGVNLTPHGNKSSKQINKNNSSMKFIKHSLGVILSRE